MAATLVIVAGPNGSGKSTVASEIAAELGFPASLDPDAMQKALMSDEATLHPNDALLQAQNTTEALVAREVSTGTSVTVETVLSTNKYFELAKRAILSGMSVVVLYVTTRSPEVNIDRVATRVAEGGHDVPEEKIRSRWTKSHANLELFASIATQTIIIDNSTLDGPPTRLVSADRTDCIVHEHDVATRWPHLAATVAVLQSRVQRNRRP